eukprot:SAG22_NODE_4074_length_1395_cov_2.347222_1_plen_46_part_10
MARRQTADRRPIEAVVGTKPAEPAGAASPTVAPPVDKNHPANKSEK